MTIGASTERYAPLAFGIGIAGVAFVYASVAGQAIEEAGWKLDGFYAAMFDWSAVQSAFLFGVFGFVVSSSNDFLTRLRNTDHMKRFLRFTRTAVLAGFLLTILSVPFLVAGPEQWPPTGVWSLAIPLWLGLVAWTVGLFVRSALIFMVLWARDVSDPSEVPA